MIERFINIQNVGRFKRSPASGDVSLRKATMVFAENGRGKTTLCTILRSLATHNPQIIAGRRTIGAPGHPDVEIRIDGANSIFRNNAWNAAYPNIAIFDGAYILENVFAGEIIAPDNRRNLYRVIIGAGGVALANAVSLLDDQIRDKNNEIRDCRARLERLVPQGMTIDSFIGLTRDNDVDEHIAGTDKELGAAQQATEIRNRSSLRELRLPTLPTQFTEILGRTLANVTRAAEEAVLTHIEQHRMGEAGQRWLSEGTQYAGDSCPFCGQELTDKALVQAYTAFFSTEYLGLRTIIQDLDGLVANTLSDIEAATIERSVVQNTGDSEWWTDYAKFEKPTLANQDAILTQMRALRNISRELIAQKASAPLNTVTTTVQFTDALTAFEELRGQIDLYNRQVVAANTTIEQVRLGAQTADVAEIGGRLRVLKGKKSRFEVDTVDLCATDAELARGKQALETQKNDARTRMDAHTADVIDRYGQSINVFLERINAGFRISAITHNYRGGTPITAYQLVINNNSIDLGDAATPLDRPSFKNTLSAGDKTTLALAFFLAQLEQDADRALKIVVFDDPFSSMDAFRRNQTVQQVFLCARDCRQVILLSHEPSCLKLLWDRIGVADRKTLQLSRIGEDNTVIAEWNIEEALLGRHLADVMALQRYHADGEGNAREIVQKLRPVLEAYCKNAAPTLFVAADTLGVMVGKITTNATHPLAGVVDQLDEINVYSRRYHHGENPNAATEPLTEDELRDYTKKTLKLAGHLL